MSSSYEMNEKVWEICRISGNKWIDHNQCSHINTSFLVSLFTNKWRGTGFDGTTTMSGHLIVVQQRITETYPKTKHSTHCTKHFLQLVTVDSCTTEVIKLKHFTTTFQELTFFPTNSAKRKYILKVAMKDGNASSVNCHVMATQQHN